ALAHLAGADGRPVTSLAIAEARGLPHLPLMKVLHALVAARLLRSGRGPRGGYRLARPAPRVTLLEVLEAVGRPPAPRPGRARVGGGDSRSDRRLEAGCRGAAAAVRRRLAGVRLSALASGR